MSGTKTRHLVAYRTCDHHVAINLRERVYHFHPAENDNLRELIGMVARGCGVPLVDSGSAYDPKTRRMGWHNNEPTIEVVLG